MSEPAAEHLDGLALGEDEIRYRVAIRKWRLRPETMVVEEFKTEPDDWQLDALRAFAEPTIEQIALLACMGPGKSALKSWLVWNFAATRPYSNIAITSITGDNLKDGLWKELRKWWRRSPFLRHRFKFTGDRIYAIDPESWFISARKWSRGASAEEQEETLRGLHAEHVMGVVDEAGCVPQPIVDGLQGIRAVGQEAKIVIGGNPVVADGPLWRAQGVDKEFWKVIQVTGDPDDPNRSPRVSIKWAREQIRRLGRFDPWVQANVIGQFPRNTGEGILTIQEVLEAFGRELDNAGVELKRTPKTLGLDVARRGKNRNSLIYREGDYVVRDEAWQGVPTTETAGRLMEAIRDFKPEYAFVDDLGIGGAVVDICHAAGVAVIGVNACERARRDDIHSNLRSEMAEELQVRFRSGRISLPESFRETTFIQEATTLRFKFDARGRRKLEDKDQFVKRLGISPDTYDALALAYSDGTTTAVAVAGDETRLARGKSGRVSMGLHEIKDNPEDGWNRHRASFAIGRRR